MRETFEFTVSKKEYITSTVFDLQCHPDRPIEFKAGQFLSILIPGGGPTGKNIRRAYSIASTPEESPLSLCIKVVEGGPGTTYLNNLKVGEKFSVTLPWGDFVFKTPSDRQVLFIATGTGVAPFRCMMLSDQFKKSPPRNVILLYGSSKKEEILYASELDEIPGLKYVPCMSREKTLEEGGDWQGFNGRVTRYLKELGDDFDWAGTDYYLCGSGDMIKEVKLFLKDDKNVDKQYVFQEKYF